MKALFHRLLYQMLGRLLFPRSGIGTIEAQMSFNTFTTGKIRRDIQEETKKKGHTRSEKLSRGFSSKVKVTSPSKLNVPSMATYAWKVNSDCNKRSPIRSP